MRGGGVSRFGGPLWVVLGLGAALVAGCAAGKQAEVKRLQAQSTYERALTELNEGQTALALASLKEAVQLDPSAPQYHNTLGLVNLSLALNNEAVEEFKRALQLDSQNGEAHHNLGAAYASLGRWEDAIMEYRTALASPGYSNLENTYHSLGWAYYNLGRLQEAEEAFRLALKLDPKMASAYYFLGLVLEKAKRRDEARWAFRQARDLGPDTPVGLAAKEHLKALGDGG